ncbi:MAG: hypothetical protein D6732_08985 [Methanobacteriota archaeon]|nr:MAG: hypothetical protein D6732_08985 [Euryarchaeota archaeon]
MVGLLLNPSVFLGNVSIDVQSHSEDTSNEEQVDGLSRVGMTMNNVPLSSMQAQASVASSSASSPFFALHQYGGLDTDFHHCIPNFGGMVMVGGGI